MILSDGVLPVESKGSGIAIGILVRGGGFRKASEARRAGRSVFANEKYSAIQSVTEWRKGYRPLSVCRYVI